MSNHTKPSILYSLISGFLLLFVFSAACFITYALQDSSQHDGTLSWALVIISLPLMATIIGLFFVGLMRSAQTAAILLTFVPFMFMLISYLLGIIPEHGIPMTVNAALVWLGGAMLAAVPGLFAWANAR